MSTWATRRRRSTDGTGLNNGNAACGSPARRPACQSRRCTEHVRARQRESHRGAITGRSGRAVWLWLWLWLWLWRLQSGTDAAEVVSVSRPPLLAPSRWDSGGQTESDSPHAARRQKGGLISARFAMSALPSSESVQQPSAPGGPWLRRSTRLAGEGTFLSDGR
ncbi:hypothetical protein BCR34DRAFT_560470 [Clohesyomyces aquaticus]|uniref:Uncharacterized protein n=1 Tax=Clohesyomyces aquaticus TaxID=1231657 RepID=A0A1Y1ZW69_9PLEO|nr:hypothetical protein BCR34DRAFT_560470 [Clohesyomyces aquaticus]